MSTPPPPPPTSAATRGLLPRLVAPLRDPFGLGGAVVGMIAGANIAARRYVEYDDLSDAMRGVDIVPEVLGIVPLGAVVGISLVLLVFRRRGAIRTGLLAGLLLFVSGVLAWALGPIPEPIEDLETRTQIALIGTALFARITVNTIPALHRWWPRRRPLRPPPKTFRTADRRRPTSEG